MFLPSVIDVVTSTFWGSPHPNPYSYEITDEEKWNRLIALASMIFQLVGVVSVIRGFVALMGKGTKSEKNEPISALHKGLMHIVGGVMCINMQLVVGVILNTMGVQ